MRTKDNGKYNIAGNTGKKKCAAFNWLKGVTAVLCAVAMYFAVTIGIRGYDMYKDFTDILVLIPLPLQEPWSMM